MAAEKQLAAAALIADTFVPAAQGLPSASQLGAHLQMLELAAANPRDADRRLLASLLRLWDSPGFGAALGMSRKRFSKLSLAERERALLRLSHSRIPAKRALFANLRVGMLLSTYMSSMPDGSWPLLDAIGYPPPFGVRDDAPPRPLHPGTIETDTELSCDVVVVGAGAGGGTTACVLAQAGLDVIVLEAGGYFDDGDIDGSERTAFTRMYAPAPTASADGQIALMQGFGLGGGTVVNYSTSFRTPDDVRAEWARVGASQFAEQEYTESLDAVCTRLGVNTDHDRAALRDETLERGCRALGWHVDAMPRDVKGCDQDVECGRCGLGCRLGAKQSTAKTWLVDAEGAGARIFTGVRVRTVETRNGAAVGVTGITQDGHRVVVRSRAVVSSAGSLQTPALLRRSGLGNANIGKYLRLHPASGLFAVYDEEIRPWTGSMQSRYSTVHRDLDGDGYGIIYETAPHTPGFIAGFVPWHGAADHARRMQQLPHLTAIAVILRDKDSGTVKVGRDGEPVVRYPFSARDREHFHAGIVGAARIAEAAGAREIYTPHHKPVSFEPGRRGSLEQLDAEARAVGYGPGQLSLAALHIMGSCRMGGAASHSAVNPDGETWDVRNLIVSDASCFPTASGVNPMISIESIAHMNARRLAARLT